MFWFYYLPLIQSSKAVGGGWCWRNRFLIFVLMDPIFWWQTSVFGHFMLHQPKKSPLHFAEQQFLCAKIQKGTSKLFAQTVLHEVSVLNCCPSWANCKKSYLSGCTARSPLDLELNWFLCENKCLSHWQKVWRLIFGTRKTYCTSTYLKSHEIEIYYYKIIIEMCKWAMKDVRNVWDSAKRLHCIATKLYLLFTPYFHKKAIISSSPSSPSSSFSQPILNISRLTGEYYSQLIMKGKKTKKNLP